MFDLFFGHDFGSLSVKENVKARHPQHQSGGDNGDQNSGAKTLREAK
jgi:hypothetical protein